MKGLQPRNVPLQVAIAGLAAFKGEAQGLGGGFGLGGQGGVVGLGEVDERAVIAEIHVPQLRVAVEAEGSGDEGVELKGEEVGQGTEGREVKVIVKVKVKIKVKVEVSVD